LSSQGCLVGTKVYVAGDHTGSMGSQNSSPLPNPPRGRGGNESPPVHGGTTGGDPSLLAIESLKQGQLIFAHDGRSREILQVNRQRHTGPIVGLGHSHSREKLWLTPDHRILAKMRPRTLGGKRDWSGVPLDHIERGKKLRDNMTSAERLLWSRLRRRQAGVKFRRQHPIGPYIADFYSRQAHLVVEIDGDSHFTNNGVEYDAERDKHLRSLGLEVVSFTNAHVRENLEALIVSLREHVRLRCELAENAVWLPARVLQPGDLVFFGLARTSVCVDFLESVFVDEDIFDLRVKDAHSYVTSVCAVQSRSSVRTPQ
jgi:adenine-specific DNA-methyltransferase